MKKHTILFLAANPIGTDLRALDREARAIRAELQRSGHRDRFAFETRWAAEPLDLLRELRELRPTVVHFSGHGGHGGLFFQAADGSAQIASAAAIAETFGSAGSSVKLVVLNACYSHAQADALLAHVECVVGMDGAIHADAARSFATGFYGGLGEHESVAAAHRQGRAAISLEALPDAARPQLKTRAGLDADQMILAARSPREHAAERAAEDAAEDAAEHFYGREPELADLLERLRAGDQEIYIIGPSGSGRTSRLARGLSRLARGVSGLGPLVARTIRPGERPSARLRACTTWRRRRRSSSL
ncbi:MAG TPA: CHAT domain-containing protein [Kofleriaceae bacterium]|nr:CHAT domain-containing protein [Kofleriaceae bacterium]